MGQSEPEVREDAPLSEMDAIAQALNRIADALYAMVAVQMDNLIDADDMDEPIRRDLSGKPIQ